MKKCLSLLMCIVMLLSLFPAEFAEATVSGDEFVSFARENCLDIPYKSGGRTTAGFDCCGLVWYVCDHYGIDVGKGNQTSQIKYGEPVSYSLSSYDAYLANLQLGDLIFFDYENDGRSNHVGIYSGNGNIIQAHRTGVNSKEDKLSGGWIKDENGKYIAEWKLTCGIRRVLSSNQCSHQYESVYENGKYVATRCSKCHTTYDYSTIHSESAGTYRVTSEYNLNFEPYADAQSGIIYSAGRQFTAVGHVINAYNDIWYETDDGYYIYSVWAELVQATSTLSISPAKTSYTIQQGSSCNIQGSITSNYNITKVTATLDGNQYVNLTPNSKSVNIGATGSGQINSFKGSELSVGTHYLVINATDASPKTVEKTITITVIGNSEPETFTITYDDNGGTGGPGTQRFIYSNGESLSTVVPSREGYTFEYWKDTGWGEPFYPGDSIPELWEDRTLVAQWRINNYTITYDANGGTGAPPAQTFTYSSGERFSTIVPTREGYTFVNWKDDWGGNYYNPGDPIPEAWGSNTLRAQWQVNYYTLDVNSWIDGGQGWSIRDYGTFDLYINGNLEMSGDGDYCTAWPYGTTYEIRNIRPSDGYSFDGFLTDASVSYGGYANKGRVGTITENTSVNIMLHTCSASIDESSEPAVFNNHTYYYFSAPVTWYDAKVLCENMGGHLATVTSAEEDRFIYDLAQGSCAWLGATDIENEGNWKWITGESFSYSNWDTSNPDNYDENPEGAENYLQYSGAGGGVWNDNAGCNGFPFVCEVDTALPFLTAIYAGNKISFHPQGGSLEQALRTRTIDGINAARGIGQLIVYTAPLQHSDCNSYGNEVAVDSSGKIIAARGYGDENQLSIPNGGFVLSGHLASSEDTNDGAIFLNNVTIGQYAGLDPVNNTASIFDSYNAYLANRKYVSVGAMYGDLPEPVRDNHIFEGWYTAAEGGTKITSSSTYCTSDLYAHWKNGYYTLNFDPNGGENAPTAISVAQGETATLPTAVPTREGFYFLGWAASADAEDAQYKAGDSLTPGGNMTLYAVWLDLSKPDFKLPASLERIEDEAFAGTAVRFAALPENLLYLGSRIFEGCTRLIAVYAPGLVESIMPDAFEGAPEGLILIGQALRAAVRFADAQGFRFAAPNAP